MHAACCHAVPQILELGYNPLGKDGVKLVADSLKFDTALETLKLGWCKVGAPPDPICPQTQ